MSLGLTDTLIFGHTEFIVMKISIVNIVYLDGCYHFNFEINLHVILIVTVYKFKKSTSLNLRSYLISIFFRILMYKQKVQYHLLLQSLQLKRKHLLQQKPQMFRLKTFAVSLLLHQLILFSQDKKYQFRQKLKKLQKIAQWQQIL